MKTLCSRIKYLFFKFVGDIYMILLKNKMNTLFIFSLTNYTQHINVYEFKLKYDNLQVNFYITNSNILYAHPLWAWEA